MIIIITIISIIIIIISRGFTIYRLLCRQTVCIPQVVLWFNESEPMIRSFRIKQCFAPIAWPDDRKDNDTLRLYNFYFEKEGQSRQPLLDFCRAYHTSGIQASRE